MTRRLLLPALVLPAFVALALATACLFAGPARADDEVSPLSRLTAQELEVLKRRLPGLETWPIEEQKRVVHNVEKLRSLDEETRRRLKDRLGSVGRAGLEGRELGARIEGFKELTPEKRQWFERHQRMTRALGFLFWRSLPEDVRAAAEAASPDRGMVEAAFYKRLLKAAMKREEQGGAALRFDSSRLPEGLREKVEKMRAEAAAGDVKALHGLAEFVVRSHGAEVIESAGPPPPPPAPLEDWLARVGARLKEVYQPSFDETVAEFAKAARGDLKLWLSGMGSDAASPETARKGEVIRLVLLIESFRPDLAKNPELAAHADALVAGLLFKSFGITSEEVAALPGRDDPGARLKAFKELLVKHGYPMRFFRQDFNLWQSGPRGRVPPGPPPAPGRDGRPR